MSLRRTSMEKSGFEGKIAGIELKWDKWVVKIQEDGVFGEGLFGECELINMKKVEVRQLLELFEKRVMVRVKNYRVVAV